MNKELIRVNSLSKSFGNKEVFSSINFSLKEGEIVSIIGSSGSGKTTFIRCMNFLEIPDSGSIFFKGEEQDAKNPKSLRALRTEVGMVFQDLNLWPHMTVLENIMEAPIKVLGMNKDQAKDHAMKLLNKVHMKDHKDDYPMNLSGGQKQRVAIARTLAMKPKVVLFDEPTSALDPELIHEVLNVLSNLAKEGLSMIIVTHELQFAKKISSRIIFFKDGKMEVEGTPNQVFVKSKNSNLKKFLSTVKGI